MSAVIVYTKPGCVQCNATYRKLKDRGIEYKTIDITQDKEAFNKVLELGYKQMPVVYASESNHWSGFNPDLISKL